MRGTQRYSAASLSAGVSSPRLRRGRLLSLAAMASRARHAWATWRSADVATKRVATKREA